MKGKVIKYSANEWGVQWENGKHCHMPDEQTAKICAGAQNLIDAAALYVDVDGPDRTWSERLFNHRQIGQILRSMGVKNT